MKFKEVKEEEWDMCPTHWKKNFKCRLVNSGRWRLEEGLVFGKWLLLMDKVNQNTCPTFADQRNFLSGLLEVDKRNDEFRVTHNSKPQVWETIRKFRDVLDEIEKKFKGDKTLKY